MKQQQEPAPYEERLSDGTDFWVHEASDYFESRSAVHRTLRDLVNRFDEAGIPYAIIGALALGEHGFLRVTTDIDVLTTREDLQTFVEKYIGLGYRPVFPGARKKFRSRETGVRIDMILEGEFPGDAKPKAVAFPEPLSSSILSNGIRYAKLEKLIELKLTSGLTAPHRARDLADIQDLIRVRSLSRELAQQLHETVRECYLDLWEKAQVRDPFDE